jgi:hypothetical protein
MCIACEMNFWAMIDALPLEARERILREQDERARFACDAPDDESLRPATPQNADERKP